MVWLIFGQPVGFAGTAKNDGVQDLPQAQREGEKPNNPFSYDTWTFDIEEVLIAASMVSPIIRADRKNSWEELSSSDRQHLQSLARMASNHQYPVKYRIQLNNALPVLHRFFVLQDVAHECGRFAIDFPDGGRVCVPLGNGGLVDKDEHFWSIKYSKDVCFHLSASELNDVCFRISNMPIGGGQPDCNWDDDRSSYVAKYNGGRIRLFLSDFSDVSFHDRKRMDVFDRNHCFHVEGIVIAVDEVPGLLERLTKIYPVKDALDQITSL